MKSTLNIGTTPRLWLALLAVLAACKVATLVVYGPIHMPDSGGYALHANIILGDDRRWIDTVNLDEPWQPKTAFRILGYPAIVALAKLVSPTNWDWLIAMGQISLSLLATAYLARLAYVWSGGRAWVALVTAIGHALGQGWSLDQSILTDSFHGSLWIIAAAVMGLGIMERRKPAPQTVLVLGVMIMAAFLMREADTVLQAVLWPIVLYWVIVTGETKTRAALLVAVFALPTVLGAEAYKSWNQYRTGERFVTTSGQTVLYTPIVRLKDRGVDLFAEDPLLRDMPPLVEPISSLSPLDHVLVINTHLHEQHGMNALDIARYGYTLFFRSWRDHPVEMLKTTFQRLRKKQIVLSFMPVDAFNDLKAWAVYDVDYLGSYNVWGAPEDFENAGTITLLAMRTLTRIFAALIFAAFVIGPPVVLIGRIVRAQGRIRDVERNIWLMALFWMAYMGYTFAYAAVSLEPRYLMPVQPFSAIIGLIIMAQAIARYEDTPLGTWLRRGRAS